MSQINRPPFGLQFLLGSKNFGVNPNDLAQQVQPQLELYPFFAMELEQFATDEVTTAAENLLGPNVTVPDGEVWDVLNASCRIESNQANDEIRCSMGLDGFPNWTGAAGQESVWVSAQPQASQINDVGSANQWNFINWEPPRTQLLWPDTRIIVWINASPAAGTRQYNLCVRYRRLEI